MLIGKELLFPPYAVKHLIGAVDEPGWDELVERVKDMPEDSPEFLAFCLLMIRINKCLICETDSKKAMMGCIKCSQLSLRLSRSNIVEMYEMALQDIRVYIFGEAVSDERIDNTPSRD